MTTSSRFAEVLEQLVHRSGHTVGQLQGLTGIPRRTIANWLEGRVQKPRQHSDLLKLASALHLDTTEVNQLLYLTGHPSIDIMLAQAIDYESKALLLPWAEAANSRSEYAPFQVVPNLPYFVGRTAELQTLQDKILENSQPKIFCLQGMGGVGKTALAVKVAYQLRPYFPDGVLWARLDATDLMTTLHSFAQAYGRNIEKYADLDSRSRVLRELLADKRALILLDNVERSEQVAPFLPPSSSNCAVIITTRRHDLDVTLGASRFLIEPFSSEESLQLFSEMINGLQVKEYVREFKKLAELLGHLPLAIIIVASRLAHKPGQEVSAFLERIQTYQLRLAELASESQSVSLSFSLSYSDLTSIQQSFFTSLGVFEGDDFSVAASAYVSNLPYRQAFDLLQELSALSLVQVRESERYALHPLLHLFACRKLNDKAVSIRFAKFFIQFAETYQQDMDAISQEFDNITAALRLVFEQGNNTEGITGVIAFAPYLTSVGFYTKASQYLELARKASEQTRDNASLAAIWRQLGKITRKQGQYEKAMDCVEKSLDAAHQSQTGQEICASLCELGILFVHQGRYKEAKIRLEQSLAIAEEDNYKLVICDALMALGILYGRLEQSSQAKEAFQNGLYQARLLENQEKICRFLNNLGTVHHHQGDIVLAMNCFQESLLLSRQLNHGENITICLNNLALLAQHQGNYDEAETLIKEALTVTHRTGFQLGLGQSLVNLGMLERVRGNYERATKNLLSALQTARQLKHPWHLAFTLNELGALQIVTSNPDAAFEAFNEANEIADRIGAPKIQAKALFGLAQVFVLQGQAEKAEDFAQKSIAICQTATLTEIAKEVSSWLRGLESVTDNN